MFHIVLGQSALLLPLLLLLLSVSVFLHTDLPEASDQRQVADRDVHLPPHNHLSCRMEEEELSNRDSQRHLYQNIKLLTAAGRQLDKNHLHEDNNLILILLRIN